MKSHCVYTFGDLPRSAVSEYMRVDWKTVGRCVHRTLNEIEPERSRRLDDLVNIGCVNQFTPECERCVDSFHVVERAIEALDDLRVPLPSRKSNALKPA